MTRDVAPRRRRVRWGWIIAAVVVVGIISALAATFLRPAPPQTAAGWEQATATTGTIDASITATGNVEPDQQTDVRFTSDGTVTEILVEEGAQVRKGQMLAKIDATSLELAVARAQNDVAQAEISYNKLLEGASPAELAQAEAQLRQAQAQLQQTQGSVTQADIDAARASLEQAQAQFAQLTAGPENTDLRAAQVQVEQAQIQLQSQRDQLSAAKTNAQLSLEQAVSSLTQAQSRYATAKQNWEYARDTGNDPISPERVGADGKSQPNTLNDAQRQQYYDTFVQSEAALRAAETSVQQAQVAYDNARQAEITGIQNAEQQVTSAQTNLDKVTAAPKNDELAAARARVQQAQAELARLTGAQRSGNIAASRAGVESARAGVDRLTADPTENTLAEAQIAIERANIGLREAEYNLTRSTLLAPFDGTVARIDLTVGQSALGTVGSGTDARSAGITLVDDRSFFVDVSVDELDIASVEPGQQVRITLDALLDADLTGTVRTIEPLAVRNTQGTTTYNVRVDLNDTDAPIRTGMTASVDIVTTNRDNAVLIPRRALQTEGGTTFVLIPRDGPLSADGTPASERRDVTIGLTNADSVEIVSGLQAGEAVYLPDVVSTFNPIQQ